MTLAIAEHEGETESELEEAFFETLAQHIAAGLVRIIYIMLNYKYGLIRNTPYSNAYHPDSLF